MRTKTPEIPLTAVQERVLLTLQKFHYLTVDQLVRLYGYSADSTNWLRRFVLQKLVSDNFLATQHLPRRESYGRNPFIYSLTHKAIQHLRGLGFDCLDAADRPSSYLFLEHSLRVSDVLIAANLLEKTVPEITLANFKHDRDLHRFPVRVKVGNTQVAVIPDGWLDFHLSPPFGETGQRVCCCIELDRATVDITPFQQKIACYTLFADGAYQEAFGTQSLTIVFLAAVGGLNRVSQMKAWTKTELTRLRKTGFSDLFLFAALPDGVVSPVALFTQPTFHTLDNDVVPLIEKVM